MSCRIILLNVLRVLILVLSLGTLGCHIAQLSLLGKQEGTGPWWPDFVPYILYYVAPIVSILSIFILFFLSCINSKSLFSDRVMSLINLLLCIAVVVYNSLKSDTVPWTGSLTKQFISRSKGYASYCSNYNDGITATRCWLVNGSWLGIIVVGFFWLLLALYTIVQRNSDIYDQDYDTYDYKQDVPMVTVKQTSPIKTQMDVPVPPKHQSFSPVQQHHQQQQYYYPQSPVYDNNEYYNMNPLREEHINYQPQPHLMYHQQEEGFERSRKLSKTYLEESNISSQPPHSYDGLYNDNSNKK
ncbi:hypothetical protein MFLAVUS_003916 [Mucor flavus]|uniref:MARVEL domain-containing protein n=1 Tax=Mucor flavus TaxID=439312 RepID=A0ABP9YUF5_9FUNG